MRNAIWIICTALCLAPAAASAQTTTTTTSTTDGLGLTKADFGDLLFMKKVGDSWEFMNKTTFDNFFNRKRCACNEEVRVRVTLQSSARSKINGKMGTIKLRAGDDTCVCQGSACTGSLCRTITPEQDMAGLLNGNLEFTFKVRDLFAAGRAETTDPATICDRDDNQNLYIWVDGPDADSTTDVTDASTQVKLDGIGPPAPTGINAVGGEEALQVSWNQIALLSDFQGYQVLCSRAGDLQVFNPPPGARFESAAACEGTASTSDGGATTSDGGVSDAATSDGSTSARVLIPVPESATSQAAQALAEFGAPPPALASLNPAYVCSNLLTSGTSTRLYQLQNGTRYVVGVVAVDLRGNPSKLTEVVAEAPTQTRDFYNGYRREGGAAEGGYCALAPASADAGVTARTWWVGLGLALATAGLRRRRKRARHGLAGRMRP